jgi:hypothetical protein
MEQELAMDGADYLRPGPDAEEPDDDSIDFSSSVTIMYISDEASWQAVWADRNLLGEFEGTREAAIAWARERCEIIRIYSLTERDVVDLGPDEQ